MSIKARPVQYAIFYGRSDTVLIHEGQGVAVVVVAKDD